MVTIRVKVNTFVLSHHEEASAVVTARTEQVFAFVDDHAQFSSHMSKSSWMMAGSRMEIELDPDRGQTVGSRIRLSGRLFGIPLSVAEVVTERTPPHRKVWATIDSPKLLVIGHYRMGFEIKPQLHGSLLRVFIDYALPDTLIARWLGRLLGSYYARWCTQRMVTDTVRHFLSVAPPVSSAA